MKLKRDTRRPLIAWAFTLIAFASVWGLAAHSIYLMAAPIGYRVCVGNRDRHAHAAQSSKEVVVLPLAESRFGFNAINIWEPSPFVSTFFMRSGDSRLAGTCPGIPIPFHFVERHRQLVFESQYPYQVRAAGPDRLLSDMLN